MRRILTGAEIPGLPSGIGSDDNDLRRWFDQHTERVRNHFASPELAGAFLELQLEWDDAVLKDALSTFLGVDVSWGCHNVNT